LLELNSSKSVPRAGGGSMRNQSAIAQRYRSCDPASGTYLGMRVATSLSVIIRQANAGAEETEKPGTKFRAFPLILLKLLRCVQT
jgi:hypothetical protein